MAIALVALGSNVGNALGYLRQAVERLSERFEVIAVSHVYQTSPMYVENQPDFLNAAVSLDVKCGPLTLLRILKEIEQQIGRVGRERYGPREVDLDLIAYGSASYRFVLLGETVLQVPHPRSPERRFVLAPLFDIAPEFVLPGLGGVRELLEATNAQADAVHRRDDASLSLHRVR